MNPKVPDLTRLLTRFGIVVACITAFVIWNTTDSKGTTMEAPEDWSLAMIRRETETYLFERDVNTHKDRPSKRSSNLFSIRKKVCQALVDILRAESGSKRLVTPIQGEDGALNLPIQRVCFLMRSNCTNEIVPLLIPFAHSKTPAVREAVAYPLGESGGDSSVTTVIKLLGDPVDDVVESTYHGLLNAEELSDQYQLALIARLKQLIQTDSTSDKLCHLLVWQSHATATTAVNKLLGDPLVVPNTMLINLCGSPTIADRAVLLKLVAERKGLRRDERVSEALRFLLILIGQQSHRDDEDLFQKFLHDESKKVAFGAVEGLVDWHGLGSFAVWLYSREELPKSLLQIRDMMTVTGRIDKYGIPRSFPDDETDQYRNAAFGFKLIGVAEGAAIIEDAIALTQTEGDDATKDDDSQWKELDRRWKKLKYIPDTQLHLFVIDHRDDFLAISP